MMTNSQSKSLILTSNILFVGLIVSSFGSMLTGSWLFSSNVSHTIQISSAIACVLVLAHYYYIRKGYRWAQLLFLILFVAGILFAILDYKGTKAHSLTSVGRVANYVISYVFQTAAAILIFINLKETKKASRTSSISEE